MKSITKTGTFANIAMIAAVVFVAFLGFAPAAHAQYSYDGGCCGGSDYYGFTPDYSGSDYYGYTGDYYSGSDYYGYTPDYFGSDYYGYTGDYSGSDYYGYTGDYYGSDYYGYTGDYYGSDYYGYTPDYYGSDYYGYTPTWPTGGMNWGGYSAAPIYGGSGYSTPRYGGSSYGRGYSYGGGSYVEPIPTWPTGFGRTTSVPTNGGTPSYQTQSQSSVQANDQVQNNPVTVVQNQAPINNSNTNNIKIDVPAPTVIYQPTPVWPTYGSNSVSCTISASQSSVAYGQYTYLTWNAYNASSATLSDIGSVTTSGSRAVQVNGSRVYTLTVYGAQGQTSTCQTQVYVTGSTYVPPQTGAYVSLSQIPYTGFDFGTVGNALYWAVLASFAVALAYLALYYKGGFAFATATARPTTREQYAQYAQERASVQEAAPAAPRMSVLEYLPTAAERRSATTDSMSVVTSASADEMPRIIINRS